MPKVSVQEMLAMRAAYVAASVSPGESTQTGAVIGGDNGPIISSCNRYPRGVDPCHPAFRDRSFRNQVIIHAERGAIYKAAETGIKLRGRTMVSCWAACSGCAQAIIDVGIRRLVVHGDRMDATPDRWRDEVDLGLKMLRDAGVEVIRLEGSVDAGVTIRFDGKEIAV